jgi:hypothetical protein
MKFDEIDETYSYPYPIRCPKCRMEHSFYSQYDSDPEYYADIYFKCSCNEFLKLKVAVN